MSVGVPKVPDPGCPSLSADHRTSRRSRDAGTLPDLGGAAAAMPDAGRQRATRGRADSRTRGPRTPCTASVT